MKKCNIIFLILLSLFFSSCTLLETPNGKAEIYDTVVREETNTSKTYIYLTIYLKISNCSEMNIYSSTVSLKINSNKYPYYKTINDNSTILPNHFIIKEISLSLSRETDLSLDDNQDLETEWLLDSIQILEEYYN